VEKEVAEAMKFRTTLIAFVLLLLFGVYVYVFEVRWPQEKREREEEASKIYSLDWSEVQKLKITGPRGTFLLERVKKEPETDTAQAVRGPAWQILEPVRTDADDASIVGVMTALRDMKQEQVIEESPEDLAPFGLQEPELRVELLLEEGKQSPAPLLVGGKSPVGENSYVRKEGEEAVLLLNTYVTPQLNKSLFDLREKKIFRIDKKDMERVEILRDGHPWLEMIRQDDTWNLVQPIRAQMAKEKTDKILDKIAGLTARSFHAEEAEDLEKFGLNNPRREVRLTLGPDRARASLQIGASSSVQEKELVYAKRVETPQVVSLDGDLLETIDVDPEALRERKVFPFQSWKVEKLDLSRNGQDITLEKKETGKWWITRPLEARAASSEIMALLSGLSGMEGTSFYEKPKDPEGLKRYGLHPPLAKVTLYEEKIAPGQPLEDEKNLKPIGTVLLGRSGGGGQNEYYACLERGMSVAEVGDEFFMKDLPQDLESLREKRVLNFYRYQAASVDFQGPEGTVALKKKGGDWKMKKPENRAVEAQKVDDLLGFLSDLKVDRFLDETVENELEKKGDPFGLDPAAYSVTLKNEEGDELGSVFFSTVGPDNQTEFRYIRIQGSREIGLIGKDQEEQLLEKIRGIEEKT
jgi:hypothetical protein